MTHKRKGSVAGPKPVEFKYSFNATKDKATLHLYGAIGLDWFGEGVTAKQVISDLKAAGSVKQIEVRINSPGGDTFEGFAIYNALVRNPAEVTTFVDGEALSAASFIMQAGTKREVAESSMVMIHNPWTIGAGDAREMRRVADLLDKNGDQLIQIYTDRTGMNASQVRAMMDEETWMTGPEAIEFGFADSMSQNMKIAACPFDAARFRNVPAWAITRLVDDHNSDPETIALRLQHARRANKITRMRMESTLA